MKNEIKKEMNNSSKVYALFYSFFLIPLMMAIFGFLFFFLFKMLTYEKQDPYNLLNNINSGSLTKRWQSAYELSNLMTDINKVPTSQMFIDKMITMYEKSIYDDSRVRTYLALAMGQTQNDLFCDVLGDGIEDKILENKIAAIKSIGMIKCHYHIQDLYKFLDSDNDNQIRLATVITLGMIGNYKAINVLDDLLEDEEANIRWDASISLAKLGNEKGYPIIKNLLNREYYENYSQVDSKEVENSILTVLALITELRDTSFKNELVSLSSEKEKNIKIREFAMKILMEYY